MYKDSLVVLPNWAKKVERLWENWERQNQHPFLIVIHNTFLLSIKILFQGRIVVAPVTRLLDLPH